jgi:diaminohydroxyphosphoribosylaminopyrimidine deaminase/5-amino-6-(5-phosphoribosylamino)uracil reductase
VSAPTRMDVASAWRLLLALPAGDARTVVVDPQGTTARLELGKGGAWTAEPEPTPEARDLLDLFLPLRRAPRMVIGQLGQSVDGRIATVSGHSHYINGADDILRLHRLRALVDAVVVGAGTALSDDPRLTVRHAPGPDPVRVVLDPRGRVPRDRALFRDGGPPTLWIQAREGGGQGGAGSPGDPAPTTRNPGRHGDAGDPLGPSLPAHVRVLRLPVGREGAFAPADVVALLGERGFTHVLVEGGGRTVSGFLAAGVLDRLHLSVAPLILGSGRPGITLPEIHHLRDALRARVRHFRLGEDLLFDLDLRNPPDLAPEG